MVEFKLDDSPPPSPKKNRLFTPPSNSMLCRQALYRQCAQSDHPVILCEFYRFDSDFSPGTVYRVAKSLVRHGILTREDVAWTKVINGNKRTTYKCAVKYLPPFSNASRKW